jgi:glucose/arabinose dehydrogenase
MITVERNPIKIACCSLGLLGTVVSCTPSQTASIPQNRAIATEILQPTPIKITIDDLPQPYATESASNSPKVIPVPDNPVLQVPEGFQVNVFADNLDTVRWLGLTPEGDIIAVQSKGDRLTLLQDKDRDGVAEVAGVFGDKSNGLDQPLGVTFADNSFYVANTGNVLRFDYQAGQEQLNGRGTEITRLTPGGYNQHWTRNIVTSPDGNKLYVSVGSRTNVEPEELPRASIQVMDLDGSNRTTYASGLRNPVGLDFHPVTKELYTAVNERDLLGDDL